MKTDEDKKNSILMIFMYASMWAFGGITNNPESKKMFESIIRNKIEGLPKEGSPLDYFYDLDTFEWKHWNERVPDDWENVGNLNFFEIIIPNLEIYKLRFLMELHYLSNRSICLAGGVGTGKTTFVRDFLD